VLGKIPGRRYAEPLAWVLGKFLPPPKNLPPYKEQADFGGKIYSPFRNSPYLESLMKMT